MGTASHLANGRFDYRQSLWLGGVGHCGLGLWSLPPCQACGPGWGHKSTVLTLFSEPRQAGCHHSGLGAGGEPRSRECLGPWHPALPSHRCPCPLVRVEGPLGREQDVGGVNGRGQKSRERRGHVSQQQPVPLALYGSCYCGAGWALHSLYGVGSVQWKLHPACHLFHFDFGFWNSSHSDYGMFVCVCVGGGDM